MVSEAMLSESILSLASAIAEKDVTSQGNGTKAKALEVLGNVLEAKGIQQLEGDDAIYALSQYAQRKSSDTVAAALGVGGCASGMVKPEGTIAITENGTHDVAQYATANVSVSGGGSSTQTLTVTKSAASDTVSVKTISWEDYGSEDPSDYVEVQPDSTEGLVSVYSIPVGAAFDVAINDGLTPTFLNAETTVALICPAMPSTPLYAKLAQGSSIPAA